jgi:hypothetical protein
VRRISGRCRLSNQRAVRHTSLTAYSRWVSRPPSGSGDPVLIEKARREACPLSAFFFLTLLSAYLRMVYR